MPAVEEGTPKSGHDARCRKLILWGRGGVRRGEGEREGEGEGGGWAGAGAHDEMGAEDGGGAPPPRTRARAASPATAAAVASCGCPQPRLLGPLPLLGPCPLSPPLRRRTRARRRRLGWRPRAGARPGPRPGATRGGRNWRRWRGSQAGAGRSLRERPAGEALAPPRASGRRLLQGTAAACPQSRLPLAPGAALRAALPGRGTGQGWRLRATHRSVRPSGSQMLSASGSGERKKPITWRSSGGQAGGWGWGVFGRKGLSAAHRAGARRYKSPQVAAAQDASFGAPLWRPPCSWPCPPPSRRGRPCAVRGGNRRAHRGRARRLR
jgi:hypothetical protein